MNQSKGHIVELQSLRGLAAVAVMIGHAANYYATAEWFTTAAKIFNGRAAVVLFFVLSGFVLTLSLRSAKLAPSTLSIYFIRRLARIYPAIWIASLLTLAYLLTLHWRYPIPDTSVFFQSRFRADRMDFLHIAASFAGALAFLLPQLWSIFVEILASFALPFIAYLAFQRRRWFIVATVAALAVSYAIGPRTYYLVGLYALDFFIGAWLAIAAPDLMRILGRLRSWAAPIALVAALALASTQFLPLAYYDPSAALVEGVLAALLIGIVAYSGAQFGILKWRPVMFIGDISYSIYVLHFLVLCLIGKGLGFLEAATQLQIPLILQAIVAVVLTVLLTIPLSWLSYRWVELPGIETGKWLAQRVRGLFNDTGATRMVQDRDIERVSTPP